MKQDANRDQAIAYFSAKENSTDDKGQNVKINKRHRDNEMVGVTDNCNRAQYKYEWQPSRPFKTLSQETPQPNPLPYIEELSKHRSSYGRRR
jgi:hypothetical protein